MVQWLNSCSRAYLGCVDDGHLKKESMITVAIVNVAVKIANLTASATTTCFWCLR